MVIAFIRMISASARMTFTSVCAITGSIRMFRMNVRSAHMKVSPQRVTLAI